MKRHTAHSERMRYKRIRCGYDQTVIKGTLLVQQSVFSSLYFLQLEEFSRNITPCALTA